MFDYEKALRKLGKFEELPGKKQKKLIDSILTGEEFRTWFYGIGDNRQDTNKNNPQVTAKLFSALAMPAAMRKINKFIEDCPYDQFDHTSCSICFTIVEQAIEMVNEASKDISEGCKNGQYDTKEAKKYKEKAEIYRTHIDRMMEAIKDRSKPAVKALAGTGVPKQACYTIYLMLPDTQFIPKYKNGMYMNQILLEIYKYAGTYGIDSPEDIEWGRFFEKLFGGNMVPSCAVTILLEGVKRIDQFRDTDYFDDVRRVWDSLTKFALKCLDESPENVRRQMMEIYMKRASRIFSNGSSPRLRVDLLSDAISNFSSLSSTVKNYYGKLMNIMNRQNGDNRSRDERVAESLHDRLTRERKEYDEKNGIDHEEIEREELAAIAENSKSLLDLDDDDDED